MKVVSFDTETFLFGPEDLAPRLVCLTYSYRQPFGHVDNTPTLQTFLTSNGDGDELYDDLVDLLELGHMLVGHNSAYDLAVICTNFPVLEDMVWAKLEAGEVDDTMIREMMLNLSTHGTIDSIELLDGNSKQLGYKLSDLTLQRRGIDRSPDKSGPDVWRLNYDKLDGMPGRRYPAEAARYAKNDAEDTLVVYEEQALDIESEDGYASCDLSRWRTMVSFALYLVSMRGMAIDKDRFYAMQDWLGEQLSDENMQLLVDAGVMDAAQPERVHGGQLVRATGLLEEVKLDGHARILVSVRGKEKSVCPAATFDVNRGFLEENGIKWSKAKASKINEKPRNEFIEAAWKTIGERPKRTPTGLVSAKDDVIAMLAPHCEVLKVFQNRATLQKLVTTEMPRLQWPPFSGKPADVVHFKFSPLKVTGRCGSYGNDMKKAKSDPTTVAYPAAPGQQFHKAIRPCYVPRKGFVLCSVDFNAMELATTAQTTLDLFGYSVHADKLRAGYDLHAYLASQLALAMDTGFVEGADNAGFDLADADEVYVYFLTLKEDDPTFFKWWRKFAKPVGLGYPGGLGPATFISLAMSTYYVDIYQIAEDRYVSNIQEFKEADWCQRLLRYGKRIHGWKDVVDFEWTRQMKAFALAIRLKDIWLETYPEMVEYFKFVSNECGDQRTPVIGTIWDEDQQCERDVKGLCYTSPMGMHRAASKFTEVANGMCMQTPGAEGALWAVIDVVKATRPGGVLHGCHVVDFIHDELLIEVPLHLIREMVPLIQAMMTKAFVRILPDIGVGTEACLMMAWRKEAEPVFDNEGHLTFWTPDHDELQETQRA